MILVHTAEAKSLVMILLFGASRFHPSRSRETLQNQRDLVFELALYTIPEVMFSTYRSELLNPDKGLYKRITLLLQAEPNIFYKHYSCDLMQK
uniref:Uncharacterized protein n=2 Tax=gambiae species complex TaxID=44542 RepID=A0A1S4HAW1_ANOGA